MDILVSSTFGNNTVIESYIGCAAAQFIHFKSIGGFVGYLQTVAIAQRGEKDVIFHTQINSLGKESVNLYGGFATFHCPLPKSSNHTSGLSMAYKARCSPSTSVTDDFVPEQ